MNSNGVLPSSEILLFQFTSLFLCGVTTWQPYISLIIQCFMNVRNTWKLIVILYENSISLDYFFRSTSLLLLSLLMSSQNHCMLPFFIVFFASWAWSTLLNQLHLEGDEDYTLVESHVSTCLDSEHFAPLHLHMGCSCSGYKL